MTAYEAMVARRDRQTERDRNFTQQFSDALKKQEQEYRRQYITLAPDGLRVACATSKSRLLKETDRQMFQHVSDRMFDRLVEYAATICEAGIFIHNLRCDFDEAELLAEMDAWNAEPNTRGWLKRAWSQKRGRLYWFMDTQRCKPFLMDHMAESAIRRCGKGRAL